MSNEIAIIVLGVECAKFGHGWKAQSENICREKKQNGK